MNWLTSLYPSVRRTFRNAIPDDWPELGNVLARYGEGPLPTEAMLPLATCRAVGGDTRKAVPVAAALIAAVASMRLFDDLVDQDRPGQLWSQVGSARAWNYAAATSFLTFAILSRPPLLSAVGQRISQVLSQAFLNIAAGQDRDLAGSAATIDEYWRTMELRSGQAYAAACASGALVGTNDPSLVQACATFGHHFGLTLQIFNDLESIWRTDGRTDPEQARLTLPLLYAVRLDHPASAELRAIVSDGSLSARADRVRELLDAVDTRSFLVWAALKEREQALLALRACPDPQGKEALTSIITGFFGDVDEILKSVPDNQPVDEAAEIPF